jgi:hypothetical protein
MLVTLQFVASDTLFCDSRFTVGQPDQLPYIEWLRGWESHPPEEVYEASLCALVEFPAVQTGGIGG